MTNSYLEKSKLLLVDDEEDMLEILKEKFEPLCLQLTVAKSGNQAIQILENESYDLVMSDMRMPDGNGLDLLNFIKNKSKQKNTPVIIFTGSCDQSIFKIYHEKAERVITKPIQLRQLSQAITHYLMPIDERWKINESNPNIHQKFTINLENIDKKINQENFELGAGGFSFLHNGLDLELNSKVSYEISFDSGKIKNITGDGVVRYIMPKQKSIGVFFGIEFDQLNENCLPLICSWIKENKPEKYIPLIDYYNIDIKLE